MDFPGGLVIKNVPANAGDTVSIPGPQSPNKHTGSGHYHFKIIILKILNIWPENEKSFPCLYIAQHSQEDSRKPPPPVSLPHH